MKVGKNTQPNTATQITQVTTKRGICLYTAVSGFFFFISVIFCLKRFGIIWDYIIIWDIWLPKSGTTVFNNKYSEGLKISLLLYFQLPNLK